MKNFLLSLLIGIGLSTIEVTILGDLPPTETRREQIAPTPADDQSVGFIPNPTTTPGAVTSATKEELCDPTFRTGRVRNVSGALKERVRRLYGMANKRDRWCATEEMCEIDHLIPLVIGGSNDVANLWPQPYTALWSARQKDRMEVRAKRLVCSGRIGLTEAQDAFRGDWRVVYRKWFGE